ncbi:ComF family protein [Candidatus Kaiserbacteria bacterium]|nr:ComF family protein [Candidatus Kaiserbacteria bacterium]
MAFKNYLFRAILRPMYRLYMQGKDALSAIIDVLMPRSARTMRTIARTETDIPLLPAAHHLLDTDITTLMDYRNPAVQDLIRSLKYDGAGHSAHICAMILADYLQEEISVGRSYSPREILLVPIPLHPARRRKRGFNQISVVLDRLPKRLRDGTAATLAPQVLIRTKETAQQARLPRTERIKNMYDAFEVPDKADVRTSRIFLIDDVTTTGATLASAAKALRQAGAEVVPIALARA